MRQIHYATAAPILGIALAAGCAKFEVVNDSSGPIEFQLAHASEWDEGEPPVHDLEQGGTASLSVNVPLNEEAARLVAWGGFVNLDVSVPTGRGGASGGAR